MNRASEWPEHAALARPSARPTFGQALETREVAGFMLRDVRYPTDVRVPKHMHEVAGIAVILEGGYEKWMRGRTFDCVRGVVTVEPAGERHAEREGRCGARCLLVDVLPPRANELRQITPLLESPRMAAISPD